VSADTARGDGPRQGGRPAVAPAPPTRAVADRPGGAPLDRRGWGAFPPVVVLVVLALAAAAAVVLFMTVGARGPWSFVLEFRSKKVIGMSLVGVAVASSTVLFQTVTSNRILTPSIMGFDSLYVLVTTVLVYFLGSARFVSLDPKLLFVAEALVMAGAAMALFYALFFAGRRSLHSLVLSGLVLGVMLRSLTNLLQRVMDPLEFAVLQDASFASFNTFDGALLLPAGVVVAASLAYVWRLRYKLDVLALGRDMAVNLGLDYRAVVMRVFFVITVLVSVSTALVGPVAFLGLLVANAAYALVRSYQHRFVLPAASLLAVITLVAGQTLLERVFGLGTSLSIIVDFVGGTLFVYLLLRGMVR
jgi:iron complex transport system permease protein